MKAVFKYNGEYSGPKAIGLGNFDGLHKGHMTLIETLVKKAQGESIKSMVYTFRQHPENVLMKDCHTPLLTSMRKKIQLLSKTCVDFIFFDRFNLEYSRMMPEDFVRDILVEKLEARIVVAGFNYRFGYKGSGGLELLERLGTKYGYKLVVIPPVKVDNMIVSSTLIRELLIKGDICRVNECLGRPYSLGGIVKPGDRRGVALGFPTANLHPERHLAMPAPGVYLTKTEVDGIAHDSITNIGSNPTFRNSDNTSIETHILDYCNNIYGKKIEVYFLRKLRDEIKFSSADKLKERVCGDISIARQLHGKMAGRDEFEI
jgi:riboflavin kinase/FMN adenylyltransferase